MGSHIEWTDETWNPTTGCTKVSAGCDHCYIDRTPPFRMAHRKFDGAGVGASIPLLLHSDRLDKPLHWRKPRKVFVNSLSDLFHKDVPDNFIGSVFNVMAQAPQHTFQILTKRPARMHALLTKWATNVPDDLPQYKAAFRGPGAQWCMTKSWPLPNVHLLVSAENQETADRRIPILLDTPAAVRGVSAEPLLGPITLRPYLDDNPAKYDVPPLDWVIVGGESGPDARPMHPDWARSIRDQCTEAGVAFLFKQCGEWSELEWAKSSDIGRLATDHLIWPDGQHIALADGHGISSSDIHLGGGAFIRRVGKKAAGRVLDGRTWDEYPAVASG